MSTELATKVTHTKGLIEKRKTQLLEVLPKHIEPDRMLRVFQNAITRNRKLLECTDLSILTTLATCGAFGLEPNTPLGQCHIIPYKDQATFQMGYQGLIELARRAGTTIRVGTVHENDLFEMECGTEPKVIHKPCIKGERGKVLGYYAIAHPPTGMPLFEYMTKEECIAHGKKYSKAFNKPDSPWQTAPDSMCLKTVVIRVCKYAPKSILAEWASVETRSGVDLQTIAPASALVDDDGAIIDAVASEPTGEPVNDLDAIAAKFEPQPEPVEEGAPWDDAPEPPEPPTTERKMSHFDLMQTLQAARKESGKTLKELEQIARDNFGTIVANLKPEQIETMIDILNNNA